MSARLGILGGMFDPVHVGHIAAAEFALATLQLDRVKLIPCHLPNHRAPAAANGEQRLEMLRRVIADKPLLQVDAVEIERGGVSYAVDTLQTLRAAGGSDAIVFIMGMDAFNSLPSWHRWQEILTLCHLLVLARPGTAVSESSERQLQLHLRQVDAAPALFGSATGHVLIAEDFVHDVSSTRVRSLLRQGEDASGLVPEPVLSYIQTHQLYRQAGTST